MNEINVNRTLCSINEFEKIYEKFLAGVCYLSNLRRRVPFHDAGYQKDVKEFELLVVDPMDALWRQLPDDYKSTIIKRRINGTTKYITRG